MGKEYSEEESKLKLSYAQKFIFENTEQVEKLFNYMASPMSDVILNYDHGGLDITGLCQLSCILGYIVGLKGLDFVPEPLSEAERKKITAAGEQCNCPRCQARRLLEHSGDN